jgi:SH3-like domain-containing protein
MHVSRPVARIPLIFCGVLFGCGGVAQAQSGTLQLPTHHVAEAPPHVQPAPLVPVQEVQPHHTTPVVRPHVASHGHKPPPRREEHRTPHRAAPHSPAVHGPAAQPPVAHPPAPHPEAKPPVVVPVPARRPVPPPEPDKGATTGMKLPRFASLRSDEVNLRSGPGTRYPIEWVYKRRDLPVEIEREFEVWRLIRDSDGIRGWVHEATLIGRRSFEVEHQDATLRAEPRETAEPVAILKAGVIGRIRSCAAGSDWCRVQVDSYGGFLPRAAFFGTLPGEVIAP